MNNSKFVFLTWKGRIKRKTYWIYAIPIVIIVLLADFVIAPISENLSFLVILAILYPSMMINIKRAHDRNKSGWFTVLLFLPIISIWPLIELGFLKGSDEANNFGESDTIWDT